MTPVEEKTTAHYEEIEKSNIASKESSSNNSPVTIDNSNDHEPLQSQRPHYDGLDSPVSNYNESGELEEFEASAGSTLLPGCIVAKESDLIEAIRTVYDPEIPVNIYDLGLIYEVKIDEEGTVDVEMSLTAPGCPVAGEMPGMVADALTQVDGTGLITVRLVWEPQWTMDLMSEDAKLALGII